MSTSEGQLSLGWCGHVRKRDSGCIGKKRLMNTKMTGRGERGRPQGRFMDVVMEDMQKVGVTHANDHGGR